MRTLRLAGVCLVAGFLSIPTLAQEEPPSIFGEEIDVRVINVEAEVAMR